MNSLRIRSLAAEFVGTACIVGAPVALSAASHLPGGDGSLAAAAWVSGLPVGAMAAALAPLGGAHMNPAVSVALATTGHFPWGRVPATVVAQILGAFTVSWLVRLAFGAGFHGVHIPVVGPGAAVGIEAVLAFFLMLVVLGAAVSPSAAPGLAPPALAMAVVCLVWIGGPATGGSMNPARSLGPALAAGGESLSHAWIYVFGPVLGTVAAAWLWRLTHQSDSRPTGDGPA